MRAKSRSLSVKGGTPERSLGKRQQIRSQIVQLLRGELERRHAAAWRKLLRVHKMLFYPTAGVASGNTVEHRPFVSAHAVHFVATTAPLIGAGQSDFVFAGASRVTVL